MGKSFEDLLERMPTMAKAVNAFDSESTKQRALDALLDAFLGHERQGRDRVASPRDSRVDESGGHSKKTAVRKSAKKAAGSGGSQKKRASSSTLSIDKQLDLQPKGKQKFVDFAAEKQPQIHKERQVCALYWLKEVADLESVNANHIYTCYRVANWKLPNQFMSNLWLNASKYGVFDTADASNIELTSVGHNLVAELPRSAD